MSDDADCDIPTPKQSGSYLMFAQMAKEIADRLETRSIVKRRRLEELDIEGARQCDETARELRSLASDFAKWPELSHELVAISRATQVPRLLELQRRAEELMAR